VTLAYPFDGHAPDETVDVPSDVARRLLNDGEARKADPAETKTLCAYGGTKVATVQTDDQTDRKPTPAKRRSSGRTKKEKS
jgi:hypothetical protein